MYVMHFTRYVLSMSVCVCACVCVCILQDVSQSRRNALQILFNCIMSRVLIMLTDQLTKIIIDAGYLTLAS